MLLAILGAVQEADDLHNISLDSIADNKRRMPNNQLARASYLAWTPYVRMFEKPVNLKVDFIQLVESCPQTFLRDIFNRQITLPTGGHRPDDPHYSPEAFMRANRDWR